MMACPWAAGWREGGLLGFQCPARGRRVEGGLFGPSLRDRHSPTLDPAVTRLGDGACEQDGPD